MNRASHALPCNPGKRRLEGQRRVRRSSTDTLYHLSCWAARLAGSHRQMKPQAWCTAGQELHARDCLSHLCLCCDIGDCSCKCTLNYTCQPASKELTCFSLILPKMPLDMSALLKFYLVMAVSALSLCLCHQVLWMTLHLLM